MILKDSRYQLMCFFLFSPREVVKEVDWIHSARTRLDSSSLTLYVANEGNITKWERRRHWSQKSPFFTLFNTLLVWFPGKLHSSLSHNFHIYKLTIIEPIFLGLSWGLKELKHLQLCTMPDMWSLNKHCTYNSYRRRKGLGARGIEVR